MIFINEKLTLSILHGVVGGIGIIKFTDRLFSDQHTSYRY